MRGLAGEGADARERRVEDLEPDRDLEAEIGCDVLSGDAAEQPDLREAPRVLLDRVDDGGVREEVGRVRWLALLAQ